MSQENVGALFCRFEFGNNLRTRLRAQALNLRPVEGLLASAGRVA
jgi:hypothetical protein